MTSKKFKSILTAVAAVSMLAGTVAAPMMSVSAGEICGETSFEYKLLPWHTCESSPAKQDFTLEDGTLHVKIINPTGADHEKWDLQVIHRNLSFTAGHKYTVSFKAKANRSGLQLYSKIGNISGNEEYCVVNVDKMQNGHDMGGEWGNAAVLTTDWQTISGTFTPTKDVEDAQWSFQYANGTHYEGNAKYGDEIWFDDMSIICETCGASGSCNADPDKSYGITSRKYSGLENNFISVNQLGYYSNLSKVAVLGDNQGDIVHGAQKLDLTKNSYDFEVVDASSGAVAFTGTSGSAINDMDSGDTVYKLDFTKLDKTGRYYVRVGDWRSFEFEIGDDIYANDKTNLLTNAMNYFYQNRSGIDIEEKYITSGEKSVLAHKGGHMTDTASVQKIWKDEYSSKDEATGTYASSKITANGGWYDADVHGKYVVNGGISVWTLQNMYERSLLESEDKAEKFADNSGTVVIPEAGNKIPDVLDEAAVELDWMTEMVVQADEPTWGKYAGMVYHKLHDHKWTGLAIRPYNYEKEWGTVRIVKPPTFAATLNYAACAAQAARLWEPYDKTKAAKYLEEAKNAYKAFEVNYYPADLNEVIHPYLDCPCPAEEIREDSLYAPMWQAKGGSPYGDNEVRDDAYWAACEIFVSAKTMGDSSASDFYSKVCDYDEAFKVTTRITGGENKDDALTTFNCGNTAAAGSFTLALHKDLLSEKESKTVEDSIVAAADEYIETENKQGYGIPFFYDDDIYNEPSSLPEIIIEGYKCASNSMVINNAVVMAYAYDLTKESKYISGVTTAMDYLLGTNPLSFSYITGYGSYFEKNPHHRYWAKELDKTLPEAPSGVLSGGPNASLQDSYVRALGFVPGNLTNPSQRCFIDSIESWSTNKVAVDWNSPLAWVVSFLQDEAPAASKSDPVVEPEVIQKEIIYGDIDLNGTVDLSDLIKLCQYLLCDIKNLSPDSLKAADCNGDGYLDITDAPRLKQFIMKDNITLGPKKK